MEELQKKDLWEICTHNTDGTSEPGSSPPFLKVIYTWRKKTPLTPYAPSRTASQLTRQFADERTCQVIGLNLEDTNCGYWR